MILTAVHTSARSYQSAISGHSFTWMTNPSPITSASCSRPATPTSHAHTVRRVTQPGFSPGGLGTDTTSGTEQPDRHNQTDTTKQTQSLEQHNHIDTTCGSV